jgi:methionyl-tRNA formyltransferase
VRLVFLGTPAAAVPTLRALVEAGHDIAVVITRPDRRRGRGGALVPSPVAQYAREAALPVAYSLAALDDVSADLGIVVAYGAIIPSARLAALPMLNVHFSLLPRWRGAAPVERALLAGDVETGVCVMGVEPTLDTGPVYAREALAIGSETADELTMQLAQIGARALVATLAHLGGLPAPQPQEGEATYAEKLTPADFVLDPTMDGEQFLRVVRLGRASAVVEGARMKVLAASPSSAAVPAGMIRRVEGVIVAGVASGAVTLETVQPEGKRAMAATAWWAGRRGGTDASWSAPVADS